MPFYMLENFPKALRDSYSIIYNYSYPLAEGLITVIVIKIPAVEKAPQRIRENAAH